MKLLFFSSYYKPELTSNNRISADTREGFVKRGHTIALFAPTPTRGVSKEVRREYKKRKRETEADGAIEVRRFALWGEGKNPALRALRYLVMEALFVWHGLWVKGVDIRVSGSTPPIHGLTAVALKKLRGIPFMYYLADLFPESLVSTGMTKKGSLLWKIGSWVSNVTYRNASRIVVISDRLKSRLIEKGVPAEKIDVIYVWIDENATKPIPREKNTVFDEFNLPRDKFYVTYAGNLGYSQNVEILADCAAKFKDDPNIRFVVFGDGTQKESLQKKIESLGLDNFSVFPMQPVERVAEVYSVSDVSLVACRKGVGGGAFPSKASTIMATGTPVLVSYDDDSDLVDLVRASECGLCVEPENVEQTVDAILKFYRDPEFRKRCGENARKVVCERFSKEKGVARYVEICEQIAAENAQKKEKSNGDAQ